MDREQRREIRKRGAASRQLTTNDIVIKTPKRRVSSRHRDDDGHRSAVATPRWQPVSQDSGALITEELSMAHSPLYHMESKTPRVTQRTLKQRTKSKSSSINKVTKKPVQTPRTPQSRIMEDYEPRVTKTKPKSKLKPKSKKPEPKKTIPTPLEELEGVYDDEEENYEEVSGESEVEFDDLYVNGTMEVRISRLPTSSARLTSIDIVLQTLMDALTNEEGKHFQTFQKLNKNHLNKLLDLNLTNNYYLYKLRDLKSEKADLRNELFSKKQEINENLMKLEKLRNQYNQVRKQIRTKRQIQDRLKNLSKSIAPISTNESILTKLNKLNNIVDPNWGLLDKLREINSKFLELDQQAN